MDETLIRASFEIGQLEKEKSELKSKARDLEHLNNRLNL